MGNDGPGDGGDRPDARAKFKRFAADPRQAKTFAQMNRFLFVNLDLFTEMIVNLFNYFLSPSYCVRERERAYLSLISFFFMFFNFHKTYEPRRSPSLRRTGIASQLEAQMCKWLDE